MSHMCPRIGVDHYTGIEHMVGVKQRLEIAHDGIRFSSPFGFDERCHVTPRAMFGFERAIIFTADNLDHRLDEAVKMCDV